MGNSRTARRSALALFALLMLLATGCGRGLTVARQAEPNPFTASPRFVVLPIDFSELRIGKISEAEWLGRKSEEQRASFTEDKRAVEERLLEALAEGTKESGIQVERAAGEAKSDAFVIAPKAVMFEPGTAGMRGAELQMLVAIQTHDGKTLDALQISHRVTIGFSSGERARLLAGFIGDTLADYLVSRAQP